MSENEAELIISAQNGCVNSFEQLINRIDTKMLSLAAGLAVTPDDAEDIFQEAMMTAYKALPNFKMQSKFSTWLYRIVVNTAISSRRKLRNKINSLIFGHSQGLDEHGNTGYETYSNHSVAEEPEKALLNNELSQAITKALTSLSEKERIAFVLCHQQEIKLIEASHIMGCTDGAVKNYLFRARQKMRLTLTEYI